MSRVSVNDLLTAAAWLDCNEGDEDEAAACSRVACFLRSEADRRNEASAVRQVVAALGVSPAKARAALAARKEKGK